MLLPRSASVRRFVIVFLLMMGAATLRPSSRLLAAVNGNDGVVDKSAHGATLKTVAASSVDIPFSDYDPKAERVLLELANQARMQAGAPRLALDPGLCRAARAHAEAMYAARRLSHQFEGEADLPQRLAAATHEQLDHEGENVALDFDAADGHQHLMLSPPHRANLLNPAYNVAGLGVVRSGDRLFIVEDFGHALPNYSTAELKDRIAATVADTRRMAGQPDLARRDLPVADHTACSMAQADKLNTASVHQLAQHYTVLSYSGLHPDTLPANAGHALAGHNLRDFSVGTCYARTKTYPAGAYWVVLSLE
jgi:uncharacterized protein YkwD